MKQIVANEIAKLIPFIFEYGVEVEVLQELGLKVNEQNR